MLSEFLAKMFVLMWPALQISSVWNVRWFFTVKGDYSGKLSGRRVGESLGEALGVGHGSMVGVFGDGCPFRSQEVFYIFLLRMKSWPCAY